MSTATGELCYRLRCLDKLGFTFRGDEAVLDAGCGGGGLARLLRQCVRDVVGVDVERVVQLRGRVRASSSCVRNLQNWLCDSRGGTTPNGSTHATASTLARLGDLADG